MTADEMFEALGYKEIKWAKDFKDEIVYRKYTDYEICFECDSKNIAVGTKRVSNNYIPLDMEELKAINKKCEELGWL